MEILFLWSQSNLSYSVRGERISQPVHYLRDLTEGLGWVSWLDQAAGNRCAAQRVTQLSFAALLC